MILLCLSLGCLAKNTVELKTLNRGIRKMVEAPGLLLNNNRIIVELYYQITSVCALFNF